MLAGQTVGRASGWVPYDLGGLAHVSWVLICTAQIIRAQHPDRLRERAEIGRTGWSDTDFVIRIRLG